MVNGSRNNNKNNMALSAISMNSAIADKEFVLHSLYHKLQSLKYSMNEVDKHNQSIIFT